MSKITLFKSFVRTQTHSRPTDPYGPHIGFKDSYSAQVISTLT